MTRGGHQAVGCIGAATLLCLGQWQLAAGFLMGCQAPDTLEFSYKKTGARGDKPWHYARLFAHRTLTHWPALWILALAMTWWYLPDLLFQQGISSGLAAAATGFVTGYIFSALFHLLLDWGTPMGIPTLSPFGRHHSLSLYSKRSELWVVLGILAVGAVVITAHYHYVVSPPLERLALQLRQWLIV